MGASPSPCKCQCNDNAEAQKQSEETFATSTTPEDQAKVGLPALNDPPPSLTAQRYNNLLETNGSASPEKQDKKEELKVIVSSFATAAHAGIPCTQLNVVDHLDGVSKIKTTVTFFLDEDLTHVKLVPRKGPEKFNSELPLSTWHTLDYDRMKELRPNNATLKALAPAEQKVSVMFVSQQGTICILVKDEISKFEMVTSLKVLAVRAKKKTKAK